MPRKASLILAVIVAGSAVGFYFLKAESPEQARERYFAKGRSYASAGKRPEAIIMFRNAVQADPKFAEAHYELGLVLMQRREFAQAFSELRRAVELKPALVQARHALGSLHLLDRNIAAAKEQLAKIAEQAPDAFEARFLGTAIALFEDDIPKALEEMREAVSRAEKEKARELLEAYIELGNIHLLNKDWIAAETAYRKALAVNPKLLRGREGLSAIYMARGDEGRALQELISATKIDPENDDAWHRLGDLYVRLNRRDEYEKLYRAFLENKPDSIAGKKKMVEILLNKADFKTAKAHTDEILRAEPGDIDGLFFRARVYLSENDSRKAHDDLMRVTTADPKFAPAFYFLGLAQIRLGNIAQARGSLVQALELRPDAIEPRLTLAEIYLNSGDPESARRESEYVLRHAPDHRIALLIAGTAELRKGESGKALALFRKAQSAGPEDARIHMLLGTALLTQKNYVQGLKELEESLSLDADGIEALNSIAVALVQQGKRKQAKERVERHASKTQMKAEVYQLLGQLSFDRKEFGEGIHQLRRAIAIKPELISAYFLLGHGYIAQNKIDEAINEYQKIIEKTPGDPGVYTILGTLHDHKGQFVKANRYYERALKINPNFVAAANNLAWNYAEHGGNLDLALPLAQKAREKSPDSPHILDTLGWIYYKKGLFENAAALLRDSSEKLSNRNAMVLYHLGMAYHQAGHKAQAREAFRTALNLGDFPAAEEARRLLAMR